MRASLWALFFSLVMATTAKAQQPAVLTASNAAATNDLAKVGEIRAGAEKGDAADQLLVGNQYISGDGVPQDYSEAVNWYRKAAVQGNVTAQIALGVCYYYGSGVTQSYADAVRWYREAANQGNANAQFDLGCCYRDGNGVPQDYTEAVKWFRKGAEQGGRDAQSELGACYAFGHGMQQDYTEAVKWLHKAADQGSEWAENNLGNCYYSGKGVLQDVGEAVKWFRKAADQGNASAADNLGNCYHFGKGVPQDVGEAVKWFRKAAGQGDALAQFHLGDCYEIGVGVPQDYPEAAKWYHKAADQGNAFGQNNVGVCYRDGHGLTQDYAEAVKWFRKAADQGNADAQHNLASCYANGNGVIKDYVQAYKWADLALAQGYELTKEYMPNLEGWMTPGQIAEGQRLARDFKPRNAGEVDPSVPSPLTADVSPTASGTGFFITQDGFLITAAHVVNGANQIRLVTRTGLITARLVKLDAANDLALLKAEGQFSALPIVSSRTVKLGNTIATVGFPNVGLQGYSPKLAKGEIASLAGTEDDPRYFQISVPVQPGNSGGALVDERGNVIGVVAAKLNAATALATSGALPENVNYAVKSSFLLGFLESVPEVAEKVAAPSFKERKFEDTVDFAQKATVLVLVY